MVNETDLFLESCIRVNKCVSSNIMWSWSSGEGECWTNDFVPVFLINEIPLRFYIWISNIIHVNLYRSYKP